MKKLQDDIYEISKKYLKGRGLEIGAFHAPTPLVDGCEADYLDQMSIDDIKKRFPKYEDYYCVYPNIIENGGDLPSIYMSEKHKFQLEKYLEIISKELNIDFEEYD